MNPICESGNHYFSMDGTCQYCGHDSYRPWEETLAEARAKLADPEFQGKLRVDLQRAVDGFDEDERRDATFFRAALAGPESDDWRGAVADLMAPIAYERAVTYLKENSSAWRDGAS